MSGRLSSRLCNQEGSEGAAARGALNFSFNVILHLKKNKK